jgi:hypothetical protein
MDAMKIAFAPLAFLLALAACHSQPTAGGLSADDERALDNAAAMLDQQNIIGTLPESVDANGAEIAAPANSAGATAANRSGNGQ